MISIKSKMGLRIQTSFIRNYELINNQKEERLISTKIKRPIHYQIRTNLF